MAAKRVRNCSVPLWFFLCFLSVLSVFSVVMNVVMNYAAGCANPVIT